MSVFTDSLPHVVYRCYDAQGRLLYIGCTRDIGARMQVHASSWNNPASAALTLRMKSMTAVEYPDKASGRAAERQAIHDEAPILNLHHQRERMSPSERNERIAAYVAKTRPPADPELVALMNATLDRFAS